MQRSFIILLVIALTLASCEGFIHISGNVYDNETRSPLENVQVLLILGKKDTVIRNQLEYDTIAYDKRVALRKQGIKDDYSVYDPCGFSKYRPSQTDKTGGFAVGNKLVGCVPKCPRCQLVFIKEGYKPLTIRAASIVEDTVSAFLEKINSDSLHSTTRK